MAVRKLANGRYQADWIEESGKRIRKNFKTKALAERHMAKVTLFENADRMRRGALKMKELTVKALAERYIDEHLELTASAGNVGYLQNYVIPRWGDVILFRLNAVDVRAWIRSFLDQPDKDTRLAISTIRKILVYFKRIFNWGIEMEIIDENPIRNVNFKKDFQKVKRRKVTIEPEQFWVLYDSMPENPEYLKQITLAAWCSGMRHGEIRGLKWRHIDFYNGLINLDADETKEAHGKAVGIEPIFMEQLNRIKACRGEVSKNDLVFQTPVGNPVSQSVFARRFKAATIAAGFEGLVLHDFRHSFTRRKRREGFDPSIIMANTGHRTDAMFRLYDRVDVEEIKDLAGGNRIGDAELLQGIDRVIEMAKKKSVTLGSVQSHIARKFRERAA